MRAFEEPTDPLDGAALDRLVAGDLPESDRRALLLRLEADPDGWRRCALAFLEDQAWRRALATPVAAASSPSFEPRPPASSARPGLAWLRRISIAASLLAAGFAAGDWARPEARVEVALPDDSKPGPAHAPSPDQPGEVHEVGLLQVVDQSAGEAPPARFPIRSGPGLDDRWLRSQPPTVPDYLRARWERQGYQVAERRKLMSVELGDGRHVSIPVDEVELDYVGQKPL